MNARQRAIQSLTMVLAIAFTASASAGAGFAGRSAVVPATAGAAEQSDRSLGWQPGRAQIRQAVGCLEQAALQWDFSTNARELALLHKAQGFLIAAARQQQGAERIRTDDLLADLNLAIERTSTHLGRLISPDGDTFGSQAPDHDQLAQLATEGQDLERGSPLPHRLLDSVNVGPTRDPLPAHRQLEQSEIAQADSDVQTWPPDLPMRWPQVRFQF